MDAATGTILYAANPDLAVPPASLTKLMTTHLVLREIEAGRASAGDPVALPPETWAENQPPRSSLMFLGPGQRVTLGEILLGMAVPSGNDAAVAAALSLAPSVDAFAGMMNEEARRLRLTSTRFTEPAGISAENRTTARDFARFCRAYLEEHPRSLDLHSAPDFAYPRRANTAGAPPRTIVQYNHNRLLGGLPGGVPGVDGLKTGHIAEAGYNIALTARRGQTRLIAVLLGSRTEEARNRDGEVLLEWGFANFRTRRAEAVPLPPLRVWGGAARFAVLQPLPGGEDGSPLAAGTPGADLVFTASIYRGEALEQSVEFPPGERWAPLAAGTKAGFLVLRDDLGELGRIPLVLKEGVERGSGFRRLLDRIVLFFAGLFRGSGH
jgi:D-alanyl-D-alanine carboxypeptidase (penicillin-binding protein 5/6)